MADAQPEPVAEALPDSLPELEPVLEPVQELQPEQAVELPTDFDALLAAATEQAATSHDLPGLSRRRVLPSPAPGKQPKAVIL